ncbi:hypothetical protein WAI453_009277 [Rhynchosporium graminicola]
MGYVGIICQLCGVAFGARIRIAHRPCESLWEYDGTGFLNAASTCGGDSGCQFFQHEGEEERIAGPPLSDLAFTKSPNQCPETLS